MRTNGNNTFKTGLLFIAVMLTRISCAIPQDGSRATSGDYREGLAISTDRAIYIAGEQVWMKLYKINESGGTLSNLSRILYVELLNDANNPVVQLKLFAAGNSGAGEFTLPDTLSSGNYLIRAYTKWMLNFPETGFAYKTISVLNPFKNLDRLINPVRRNGESLLTQVKIVNERKKTDPENGKRIKVDMGFDKPEYSGRQKIGVDVSLTDSAGKPADADLSLSVVKSVLADTDRNRTFQKALKLNPAGSLPADSVWLPEPEGEVISGTIRNKQTNEPLINADIMFSVVGKTAATQFGHTNSKGEFRFLVNRLFGPREIVIQPFLHDDSGCYVELNQPYCSTFSDAAPGMFYLDSLRAAQINNAVITMQVDNLYRPFRQSQKFENKTPGIKDFYGQPSRRVLLSDYIELTNVREVVREILPEVRVFRKYDKSWFKIVYDNPYQKFENQALVLIDGVPVSEIESLLDMQSKDLERIDIISVRYFYGDFVFDGIVSFFTRKGNLGDLKFDESVFRQIYEGCEQPEKFYSPVYAADSARNNRIPDFRNTLYWDPSLKPDNNGKARAEFYASDEPGEYSAIIEGLTSEGIPVYSVRKFRIK